MLTSTNSTKLSKYASGVFSEVHKRSYAKPLIMIGLIALALGGCASNKKTVLDSTTKSCMNQRTVTESEPKTIEEKIETSEKDGTKKTETREKEVETIVEQYRINTQFNEACASYQILVLTAQAQENSPLGIISSMALLHLASSKDLKTKEGIIKALKTFNDSIDNHQQRVDAHYRSEARSFIAAQISTLRKDNGEPNLPTIATLLDLYHEDQLPDDKRRFPQLPITFIRRAINIQLGKEGLTIKDLRETYKTKQQSTCKSIKLPDGSSRTRCHQQNIDPFIINQI